MEGDNIFSYFRAIPYVLSLSLSQAFEPWERENPGLTTPEVTGKNVAQLSFWWMS
jgi:hypothetical protein